LVKKMNWLNWYVIDNDGFSGQCRDEAEARKFAKRMDILSPKFAPRRVVQLVEYVEPELTRLSVACDVKTLCANGDLPDSMEVLADWIAAGEMPDTVVGNTAKIDQKPAEALEQPVQEPVAWIWKYANGEEEVVFVPPRHVDASHVDAPSTITPVYTSPPAQPAPVVLTDEQARDMPDCWVVVKNGQILATHDGPSHYDGIQAVRYAPAAQR
jgi:hypothetical protein